MIAGLETFAKVRALHDRTDNPGEKAAAAGRMEALARTAGMTVAEAVSKLDAPAPTGGGPSFSDIFDTPFFRQAKADADRERAEKWRKVLAEYGSEEAVFAPCEWELALERACDPYVVRKKTTGWPMGSLLGWFYGTTFRDPAPQVVEAIRSAYPMPETVRQAWAEFAFWDKLGRDREARGVGCGDHRDWVYFRVQLVERLLNALPAAGLADLRARMDWMDWRNDLESAPDPKEERVRLATLRADIERMGAKLREEAAPIQNGQAKEESANSGGNLPNSQGLSSPDLVGADGPPIAGNQSSAGPEGVQSGHESAKGTHEARTPAEGVIPIHPRRTNADKRRDVLALLNLGISQVSALTDREIARRAGVSPQTVGNIRRSLS